MRAFAVGSLMALAVGSMAMAAPITDEQLSSLNVGVTTYDQVIATLGRPVTTETSSDGSRAITYSVVKTHVKGATYVPIVGLFAGGATGHTVVDRFEFGPTGLLSKILTSETNVDCGVWRGCGSK